MLDQYTHLINKEYIPYVALDDVFANQEDIFQKEFGEYPNIYKRYLSPFRQDKNPSCRFALYNGLWYFIDNAGYNGKIAFNCVEVVMYKYDISFKDALQYIQHQVPLVNKKIQYEHPDKVYHAELYFKAQAWTDDNYFTIQCKLPIAYLEKQNVYQIDEYWANNKSNWNLTRNMLYNPKKVPSFAYLFDENKKLYFPNQPIRFLSNCNNDDIFGWHRMGDYLFSNNDTLVITKSGKDDFVLNYHLGLQSIAFQNEVINEIPEKLLNILKSTFNTIIVWFDPDKAGIKGSKRLIQLLQSHFPTKTIINLQHDISLGKDPTEIIQNNHNLKEIFNYEIRKF